MIDPIPELAHAPRGGDLFELAIEDLSLDGLGTARLDVLVGPQRLARRYDFCVRNALPGDRVKAQVESRKRDKVTARITEFIEPSPMRIEPRCQHFGRREIPGKGCGGCTFQSLTYRHQLIVKERMVKRQVQSHGIDPGLVFPMIGVADPWYYRNKMEFSFGSDHNRDFALGLFPKGFRYQVLNLKECFLQSSFTSDFLPKFRDWAANLGLEPYRERAGTGFLRTLTIREGKRTGERMIELTTSQDETARCGGEWVDAREIARRYLEFVLATTEAFTSIYWTQQHTARGTPTRFIEHHLHGKPTLTEAMHLPGGQILRFEIHPRAFFQPNTLQAEVLYAQVLQNTGLWQEGAPPDEAPQEARVLDLYCGTGTIAQCLAPFCAHVVGIELQPDAVDNARQNAARNGVTNTTFFAGDVAQVLQQDDFRQTAGHVDLVVVDPPRAGLLPQARAQLKQINPPRIVYVSCNPQTLARDLADLSKSGYRVEHIQPVDMFPHTYHIENVALLTRD